MQRFSIPLFILLHLSASTLSPLLPNEDVTYTVDGENDCSDSGNDCTSLSQASEALASFAATAALDTTYTIIVHSPITDSTERPIVINNTLTIRQQGLSTVSITNDTTPTSHFMTIGCPTSVFPIDVSIVGLNFSLYATGARPDIITGNVFRVDPTALTLISLTLHSLSILGANPMGIPTVSNLTVFDMAHGTLTLDAVTISSIHIMMQALITITGGSFYSKNGCTLNDIASYNADQNTPVGGAITAYLIDRSVLNVAGTTFSSCSSLYCGGAICMVFLGECSVTIGGMKYSEEVSFTKCTTYGIGGALFVSEMVNVLIIFNRIEYVSCDAGQAGQNLFFTSDGVADLTYYIMQMDEILKGQHASPDPPYDFIAQFKLDAVSGTKGLYPLYFLSEIFACKINITQTETGECETQEYEGTLPIDLPTIAPGTSGQCPSLKGALWVTDSSHLPCGNTITLLPGCNLQPSNFTGTSALTVTILGMGETISLGLTNLITEPMITVGPGFGLDPTWRDRVIMFTLRDVTITIQRTEAVYLRQSLFKIDDHFILYDGDRTKFVRETVSTALHYLELNTVNIISGNEYEIGIDSISPAVSISPLAECADGTVLTLKYVTFSNIRFITSTDMTGTYNPSIFRTATATLLIIASSFENITLADSPLFEINPNPLDFGMELPPSTDTTTIDNINTFKNIIRINGSGSIINTELSTPAGVSTPYQLAITNAYFSNCRSDNGNGGVVYISSLDTADQIIAYNLIFAGCSATIGNRFYVLSDTVTATQLAEEWITLENDCLMNNDFQVKTGMDVDRAVFDHLSNTDVMMVDVNRGNDAGTDQGQCGSPATIPCKTIYMAYTNRLPTTTALVLSPGSYLADIHPITLISSIAIRGGVDSPSFVKKPIKTVTGGVFFVPDTLTSGDISFSFLTFNLVSEKMKAGLTGYTESTLTSPVISSNSFASITLSHIIIQMADPSNPEIYEDASITSPPIIVTAGSLFLDSVVCSGITLESGSPFISTEAPTVLTLNECVFQDITLKTRSLISTSSIATQLIFTGTNESHNVFTNIHRLSGDGAVLQIDLGGQYGLNLAYCSFINCTSEQTSTQDGVTSNEAKAGAVYLNVLSDDGVFTFDPTTVTFSLTDSPTGVSADDGTTIPYFDATFNAPWKSAVTIGGKDGTFIGTATSGYTYTLMQSDTQWNLDRKYCVFILDDNEHRAYNNTLLYAMSRNIGTDTGATITPTGGDLPGCGLSGDDNIPCASIVQCLTNLQPTSSAHVITLSQGTHRGSAFYNTELKEPVTITGTYDRSLSKTFVSLEAPSFLIDTLYEPPIIEKITITVTSGGFVVNIGDGGFILSELTITGIVHPTVAQRLVQPLVSSIAGNITLNSVICQTITVYNCMLMTLSDGAVTVSDSAFTSITGHSPGTGGTVLRALVTTLSFFTVTNTKFTACHTQQHGGALFIEIRTSGFITMDTVTFTNCSSVLNGGAVYILASQKPTELAMADVTFDGATGSDPGASAEYGIYMFYQSSSVSGDIAFLDVEYPIVRAFRAGNQHFVANQSSTNGPSNMYELRGIIRVGGENSSTEESCGSVQKPCSALDTAVYSSLFETTYIFCMAASYIPAATRHILVDKNMTIYGLSENGFTTTVFLQSIVDDEVPLKPGQRANQDQQTFDQPLIHLIPSSYIWGYLQLNMSDIVFSIIPSPVTPNGMSNCFLLAEGLTDKPTTVRLDTITFKQNDTSSDILLLNTLLQCNTVLQLEFYDVTFSHLTINDSSLLQIPVDHGSQMQVNSLSTFDSITRKHGNGAIISETLKKGSELSFSNVLFRNCVCEDGNGGAVYINFEGGKLIIGGYEDEDTGYYDPTTFSDCKASGFGGALYFEVTCSTKPDVTDGDDVTNLFLVQNVDFTGENDMERGKYVYATGKSGIIDEITLWKHLIPLSTTEAEIQYFLTDAPSEEEALNDIYTIVPTQVTVTPFTDEDKTYCRKCKFIGDAMYTFASFARSIYLDFSWRDAELGTLLYHDVTFTSQSTATIIYAPNTHPEKDKYLIANVPRTNIVLQDFGFVYNKTDVVYPYAVVFLAIENDACMTLSRMQFSDSSAGEAIHGGHVIDASSGILIMKNCVFNSITLDSHSALSVSTKPGYLVMEGHNLFNTILQDNSTFYTGGTVFDLTLEGGDGIKISGANFSACTTSTSGALMRFHILDAPDEGSFVLENNYYFGAGASERANKADDTRVALVVSSLTDYVQGAGVLWTSLLNGHDDVPDRFVWITSDIPEDSPIPLTEMQTFDLRSYRYHAYYVDSASASTDNTQCTQTTLCPYLHYAADLSNKAQVEETFVYISSGTLNNAAMQGSFLRSSTISGTVSDVGRETTLAFSLEGTGLLSLIAVGISKIRNEATECTFKDFLVTVASTNESTPYVAAFGVVSQYSLPARLILDSISFSLNTEIGSLSHAPLQTPLIKASSGCLRLVNVDFNHLVFGDYPLIEATPKVEPEAVDDVAPVSLTDLEFWGMNSFTNITRSVGYGAVFHFDMKDNYKVLLDNCTFNLNSATLGGCIYINITANVSNASYAWDSNTLIFSTPGTFDNGAYIYIYAENEEYLSETYHILMSDLTLYQADVKDVYVLAINTSSIQSEYQFYESQEIVTDQVLIVSDEPGHYPRLIDALAVFNEDLTKRRMFLKRHLTIPPLAMDLSRDLSISGLLSDHSKATVPIDGLPSPLYTVIASTQSVSITVNDLAFHLNSTPEHPISDALFTTSGDLASIITAECTFDPVEGSIPLTTPIYNCNDGTLGLSKCTFSHFVMASTCLITLPAVLANFGVYATTTFSDITRNTGSGSIFEVTVDAADTLTLENMNFINCTTKAGHGGVVSITLRFRSLLVFNNLEFTNCTAQGSVSSVSSSSVLHSYSPFTSLHLNDASAAKGGAVYIELVGEPDNMALSGTTVSSCSASEGSAFYIDASSIATPDSLFWTAFISGVSGAKEGDLIALVDSDSAPVSVDLYPYTLTVSSAQATSHSSSEKSSSSWVLIVVIVSSLVVVLAAIVLIYLCCRKHS